MSDFHHWGISKDLSRCQCKFTTENVRTSTKTGNQLWNDATNYALPYELTDGSLIDAPATIPTGYVIIKTVIDNTTGERLPADLLLYGGIWGYSAESSIYVCTSTGTPEEIAPAAMEPISDYASLANIGTNAYLFIGSGALNRTTEILSAALVDLGNHYTISSEQPINLSLTDQFSLSGKCYRLRTTAPTVNVNFEYKGINANTAGIIYQRIKDAIKYDDKYEVLIDKVANFYEENLMLIAGSGPAIRQDAKDSFSVTIAGRLMP